MTDALRRVTTEGWTVVAAELTAYLRRAGVPVTAPPRPSGPWAPRVAGGRTTEAVAAWARMPGNATSERSSSPVAATPGQRDEGLKTLVDLGAVATIPAVD